MSNEIIVLKSRLFDAQEAVAHYKEKSDVLNKLVLDIVEASGIQLTEQVGPEEILQKLCEIFSQQIPLPIDEPGEEGPLCSSKIF